MTCAAFFNGMLTAPYLLVLLQFFAILRFRPGTAVNDQPGAYGVPWIASALVLLFAGIGLTQAVTFLVERRRQTPVLSTPCYDREIFTLSRS